ncbi:hypothetical protein [Bordetella bronchialis]|uniref:hypothetical protein n=1 Tax=Bordetella bronchialis TaxID=463025 RepID=UPI0012EA7FAE|nr:hypothetical protein [Bordetella bronchialis]
MNVLGSVAARGTACTFRMKSRDWRGAKILWVGLCVQQFQYSPAGVAEIRTGWRASVYADLGGVRSRPDGDIPDGWDLTDAVFDDGRLSMLSVVGLLLPSVDAVAGRFAIAVP